MIGRRGFLAGILGAAVAPAFVPAKILMPVRKIIVPEPMGYLEAHALKNLQMHVTRQWALALEAVVLREGRLEKIVRELAAPGGPLAPGDELRALHLQPGDQVLRTAIMQAAVTGEGAYMISMRELPTKGRP